MNDTLDRLHILYSYQILDSDKDESFDNLTRIASKVCDTAVSLISLVDKDRQWFKSHYGLSLSETPLSQSVCKQLVNGEERCLHVEDLNADQDYQQHPALTELGIQFYAGFPIKTQEGVVLGSFCVLDFEPKELTDLQLDFLKSMADQAMRLIESHRERQLIKKRYQVLQKQSELIDKGTLIAKLGGFYFNLDTKYIFWVEGTNRIFDLPQGYAPNFEELIKPENSAVLSSSVDCLNICGQIRDSFDKDDSTLSKDLDSDSGNCYQVIVQKVGHEVTCVIRDQTQYRNVQRELEKSQNLMEEVEAISKVGGWQINVLTEEVFWTENTYEIFDLPKGTPLSIRMLRDFYQGESVSQMEHSFSHALQSGEGYVAERRILSAKNRNRWVRVKVRPIMNNGICERIFGSFQDITEEVKLRKDLKERREQALSKANYFQSLVDNQSFFIVKTDLNGNFTFVNAFFLTRFFINEYPHVVKDLNIFDLIHAKDQNRCKVVAKQAIKNPDLNQRIIISSHNLKENLMTIQWDVKVILNETGIPVEFLCMGQDVTELYQNKSELQNLVNVVSNQNKRLVEYTNIISHNIRSHVANLSGLCNLIDLITDKKVQLDYFVLLKEAIQKLDETITELNMITKVQHQTNLTYEEVNLEKAVEKTISILIGDILNSATKVTVNIDSELYVHTVPTYLESIILNLITNAITYRNPDRELCLNISAYQTKKNEVLIRFEDNGIGINMERHGERVFKLYQTVGKNPGSKGMGLYMVKSQLESMGGRISLESQEGVGSIFTIHLKNA